MTSFVYDIECYPNFFSATFIPVGYNGEGKRVFHCRNNENPEAFNDLRYFIKHEVGPNYIIGYNSIGYDDILLNLICQRNVTNESLYKASQDIITNEKLPDYLKRLKWKQSYKSIDLMKILAFDKLKISLKTCSLNLKWHRVQDLPIHYESAIAHEQVELILDYNLNDVLITNALYEKLKPELRLRYDVGAAYGLDLMNSSNSNMGDRLLNKIYSEQSGLELDDFRNLRTYRKEVKVSDILSDQIEFQTPEMKKMFESVKNHVIKIGEKKKPNEKGIYNLIFKGKRYAIAKGGLHSDNPSKIYHEDEKYSIITCDVASYYPSLIIAQKAIPEHLGETFLKAYTTIITDRIKAKKELGSKSPKAEALKIAANAVYGKLNFEYYWLLDPKAAFKVTMNGQLLLLMLIEKLEMNGIECIMANTDGIECRVSKDKENVYYEICKNWEKYTNLVLEYDYYKSLIIRDVNNYVSITRENKIKEKGTFLTHRSKVSLVDELKRAFDMPIISEALHQYFINGIHPKDTIANHKDIYDFCTSQKVGSNFQMEYHYIDYVDGQPIKKVDVLQKTNRFYVSTKGGVMIKRDREKNTTTGLLVGKTVTIFNDYFEADDYFLDKDYYLSETMKIINSVTNNFQTDLFG